MNRLILLLEQDLVPPKASIFQSLKELFLRSIRDDILQSHADSIVQQLSSRLAITEEIARHHFAMVCNDLFIQLEKKHPQKDLALSRSLKDHLLEACKKAVRSDRYQNYKLRKELLVKRDAVAMAYAWSPYFDAVAQQMCRQCFLSIDIVQAFFQQALEDLISELKAGKIVKGHHKDILASHCREAIRKYIFDRCHTDLVQLLVSEHQLENREAQLIFIHVLELLLSNKKKQALSDSPSRAKSLSEFLRLACCSKVKWIKDHPEQALIDKLKKNDHQSWLALYQNLLILHKDEGLSTTAITTLYNKLQEPDFRFYCLVNTYLSGIVQRLKKDKFKKAKSQGKELQEYMLADDSGTSLSAESQSELTHLMTILTYHWLMIQKRSGHPTDASMIEMLHVKHEDDKTWGDLIDQYELGEGTKQQRINRLKQRAKTYRRNLANRKRHIYRELKLMEKVIFQFHWDKARRILTITFLDYRTIYIRPIVRMLRRLSKDKLIVVDHSSNLTNGKENSLFACLLRPIERKKILAGLPETDLAKKYLVLQFPTRFSHADDEQEAYKKAWQMTRTFDIILVNKRLPAAALKNVSNEIEESENF
ncbi:MAG: hypothetical protein AAFV95_17800 [Bacteroidota bacterium]